MTIRLPAVAAAMLFAGVASAVAGELPSYEAAGFPVSQTQVQVLAPADAQQQSPVAALTRDGMPASPHQVAVLAPHKIKVGALATDVAAR